MKEFLKGNYKVDAKIAEAEDAEASGLESEFERKALSRLGGSICFVSKKSFVWQGEASGVAAGRAETEDGERQRAGATRRVELGRRIARALEAVTFDRIAAGGLANAKLNQPRIRRSVLELAQAPLGDGDAPLVVATGPSFHRRRSLDQARAAGFRGTIVAADGALGACLRAGVVPHVVVSVDPHPGRIVRWFGDPSLAAAP